jgi:hypothetical protein
MNLKTFINQFLLLAFISGIGAISISCNSGDGDDINENSEVIAVDFFLSNE